VLPIERGAHLAREDVLEGQELVLTVAEHVLCRGGHPVCLRRPDCASHHRGGFDLDAATSQSKRQSQVIKLIRVGEATFQAWDRVRRLLGDSKEAVARRPEGLGPRQQREKREVYVHGEAGEVAEEEIDRCSALQCELFPMRDEGQHAHNECRLTVESVVVIHAWRRER